MGVVECGPTPLVASSCEDSNNEVDEFFTLLDTTLHLSPSPHPLNGELVPPAKIAFTEPEGEPQVIHGLVSGVWLKPSLRLM